MTSRASQANWLHKAESQLEKLSQVAVFMPDPDPDPMNAMALAPAEALENVTSYSPTATAETKAVEAAPAQKTTTGGGTELAGTERCSRPNQKITPKRRTECGQIRYPDPKTSPVRIETMQGPAESGQIS
jgi:hypothetical protein